MQPNRTRLTLAALLGLLALSALTAAAAQAVEAPRWSIEGKNLEEGKTHYITAKIYTTSAAKRITLEVGAVAVSCLATRLKSGVLLGSSAGNAGKGNGVLELYGNCTVAGNGEKCSVTEPIVTNNLKAELVETEKGVPGTSGSLLVLFEAENAASGIAAVNFFPLTGGKCTFSGTTVSGKIATQVLTDPENGTLGKLVELPKVNSTEAKSWLLNFPVTRITKIGRIKGGVLTEEKIELTALGETATMAGTALVLLAEENSKGELESEGKLWSPLP